jgi:hypothetical protein
MAYSYIYIYIYISRDGSERMKEKEGRIYEKISTLTQTNKDNFPDLSFQSEINEQALHDNKKALNGDIFLDKYGETSTPTQTNKDKLKDPTFINQIDYGQHSIPVIKKVFEGDIFLDEYIHKIGIIVVVQNMIVIV